MLPIAQAHGAVHARQCEIADGGGVDSPVIHLHAGHPAHLLHIPDTAPDHRAAVPCFLVYGGGQVAAQEGALIDFIVHIDDDDVAADEAVDHPLIGRAGEAPGPGLLVHDRLEIGADGGVHGGDGAAHQLAVHRAVLLKFWVQGGHGGELVFIALHKNGLPQFLQRHAVKRVQVFIRHLGPSVRETLPRPGGGQGDDFLTGIKNHGVSSFCVVIQPGAGKTAVRAKMNAPSARAASDQRDTGAFIAGAGWTHPGDRRDIRWASSSIGV